MISTYFNLLNPKQGTESMFDQVGKSQRAVIQSYPVTAVLVALATCALIWEVHPGGPPKWLGARQEQRLGIWLGGHNLQYWVVNHSLIQQLDEKQTDVAKSSESLYTLWQTNIAMDNGHFYWVFPLKMVIIHSYVSLPEGNEITGKPKSGCQLPT